MRRPTHTRWRRWRCADGYTTTLFLSFIPVMMAMAGLMVDGGMYMLYRMKLAAAVDAAAIKAAGSYKEELHDQGLLKTHEKCLEHDAEGKCTEWEEWNECWQIWVHRPTKDADDKGTAFATTVMKLAEYQLELDAWQEEETDPPSGSSLPSEANGRARWTARVSGSAYTPLYFLRIFGQQRVQIHAKSNLTWERKDKFRKIKTEGSC